MKQEINNSILVAMSGGVDSSVTALLLKQAGYSIKGAILRMHDADMTPEDLVNGKLPQSIWYAREAARRLRLDFSIVDVRDSFRQKVEEYFIEAYQQGLTPNPCVYCNAHMKFSEMFRVADELGCGKVASGHYAIIEFCEETGRYIIRKGKDRNKDQSYMLYQLTQEQLARLITPLGNYQKEEIRQMAEEARLKNARVPDSQDICFIPDGDYGGFISRQLRQAAAEQGLDPEQIPGLIPGDFVDREGHVLGRHKGLIYYTVGQRKGLGLAFQEPLYVYEKRPDTNQMVLSSEEALFRDTVRAGQVHFSGLAELPGNSMRVSAKIRYSHQETMGTASLLQDGTLEVRFDTPVRAPAPGQSMVLYDDDRIVAGGIIL